MKFLDEHIELLEKSLQKYGKQKRILKGLEELSELSCELFKNVNKNRHNEKEIAEEMVDVYILLEQFKSIYGITEDELFRISCNKFKQWQKAEFEKK